MPYQDERASRLGHVPTVNNKAVRDALQRWTITTRKPDSKSLVEPYCHPLDSLETHGSFDDVEFSITVDGSDSEVETTRDHPTVKVGYVRVAASVIFLDTYRHLGTDQYIDPKIFRKIHRECAFDVALPGAQLQLPGLSGVDTWRSELDRFFADSRFDSNTTMTLADGLLTAYGATGAPAADIELRVCPTCKYRSGSGSGRLIVTASGGTCPECRNALYLIDVLRTHEEYNIEGSNFSPLTRVMNITERLMTLCYLEHFARTSPDALRHTLFITDGPLALHGTVAPIHTQFQRYLASFPYTERHPGPLMVGIEKNKTFVEHAELIKEYIEPGHVMMLTNEYINRVTGRPPSNQYGTDEFYGRRFIYRTRAGDPLVITVLPRPGIEPYGHRESEKLSSYPTLRVICEVLDSLRTRMYRHAVVPVALAHSAASFPLGVGHSVLTMMAQQNIAGLKVDNQAVKQPVYPR